MAGDQDVEIVGQIRIDDDGTAKVNTFRDAVRGIGGFTKEASGHLTHLAGVTKHLGNIIDYAIGGLAVQAFQRAWGAITNFFSSVYQETVRFQNAMALTEAVIKSTGGVAGITAENVKDLGASLSLVTRFSEETIMEGQNLLLTFTAIGKNVFPEATEIMLDMSQALGQDLKSSAIQLGKALQDPILGVTALRRVGVNFNEESKKIIENLMRLGKVEEAQKFILRELQTEFGGAARAAGETLAGRLDILKNQFGEVKESIGMALLPTLTDLGEKVIGFLLPAFTDFGLYMEDVGASGNYLNEHLRDLPPVIRPIAEGIGRVVSAFQDLIAGDYAGAIRELFPGDVGATIYGIAKRVEDFITDTIIPFYTEHKVAIIGAIKAIAAALIAAGIVAVIVNIVSGVGLINLAIAAIVAVIGIFGAAWATNWMGIRDAAMKVWGVLKPAFDRIVEFFRTLIPSAIATFSSFWNSYLVPMFSTLWEAIRENVFPIFQDLFGWFSSDLPGGVSKFTDFWNNTLLPALGNFLSWYGENILPVVTDFYVWLIEMIPVAIQFLSDVWNNILLPAIQTAWAWIQENIIPLLQQLWDWLATNIPIAIQTMSDFWNTVLVPALQAAWAWIQENIFPIMAELWNWLANTISQAIQTLSDFWTNTLLPAINGVWAFIQDPLFPLFLSIVNFMDAVFGKALEALAGFWQKVLLPALQDVWKEISEHVLPVFKDIATWIADKLGPVLQDAGKWIQDHLVSNFDAVVGIIQTIIGWINTLAERIRNMQLPDWLTPGSPTPFELGLVGISRALQGVTGGINLMNQTLATSTVYGPSTSNIFNLYVNSNHREEDLTGQFGLMQSRIGS